MQTDKDKTRAVVLGAGSWGTALAQLLASNGHNVTLWMRDAAQAEAINANRQNCLARVSRAMSSKACQRL